MDFPLRDLLDPERCYDFLLSVLHSHGFGCPQGHAREKAFIHKRDRAPILDYRCRTCGRCFNLFTGTVMQGTKYNEVQNRDEWEAYPHWPEAGRGHVTVCHAPGKRE